MTEGHRPGDSPGLGLLFALLGFGIFSIGDALAKSMAGQWPATAISALRYCYGLLLLGSLVLWRSGWSGFKVGRYDLQFARGLSVSIAGTSFFFAVQLMPLADATSIQFTSPIWVALLAPWLLRERATPVSALCTLLALAGVTIVLRPNLAHLGPVALLPLVAALGLAFLVILNRKSLGTAGVLAMQFWVVAMATPILLIATTLGHLSGIPRLHVGAPTPIILFKCACIAVIGTVAHWLIYIATERASAPVVAPMIYFQLLIAGTLGWLVFGHGVDLVAAVGMAVIILAGLLLWRSQRNPLVVIPPD